MHRIAIILLNFNSASDCAKSVGLLLAQKDVEADIILVDNGSHPDDLNELRHISRKFNLTLLESEANLGYNGGNNIGLRLAADRGHDIALILNPDIELTDPYYIAGMIKSWSDFPDTVIAGSDIILNDKSHLNPLDPSLNWGSSFEWFGNIMRKLFHIPNPRLKMRYSEPAIVDLVHGSAFFVKLDFIKEIGFLDEANFLYCEEWILERQARKLDKKALFVPQFSACHNQKSENVAMQLARLRHQLNSRLYWLNNYSHYPSPTKWISALSFRLYYFIMSTYKKLRYIRYKR